jgi:hypothetical protein
LAIFLRASGIASTRRKTRSGAGERHWGHLSVACHPLVIALCNISMNIELMKENVP